MLESSGRDGGFRAAGSQRDGGHERGAAQGDDARPPSAGDAAPPDAAFGTAVFAYGGWPFLQGAGREIRERQPGMMTLIALGVSVAFSAAVTLGYPGMPL